MLCTFLNILMWKDIQSQTRWFASRSSSCVPCYKMLYSLRGVWFFFIFFSNWFSYAERNHIKISFTNHLSNTIMLCSYPGCCCVPPSMSGCAVRIYIPLAAVFSLFYLFNHYEFTILARFRIGMMMRTRHIFTIGMFLRWMFVKY